MRYELSDCEWDVIKPMLPIKPRDIPRVDDRRILNGIFWVLRSGASWRDLPQIYGPCTTCYNQFVRWRRAGVWDQTMEALAADHDMRTRKSPAGTRGRRGLGDANAAHPGFGHSKPLNASSGQRTN
jgi:transposase